MVLERTWRISEFGPTSGIALRNAFGFGLSYLIPHSGFVLARASGYLLSSLRFADSHRSFEHTSLSLFLGGRSCRKIGKMNGVQWRSGQWIVDRDEGKTGGLGLLNWVMRSASLSDAF